MLFSQTIDTIDSEITALLAELEAKKQQQSQLIELDALTDHTLQGLADVVSKIQCSAPDAIASLKTAVLTLFDSGDDGSDGGNQPTDPTPTTDPALSTQHPIPDSDGVEDVNFIDENCLEYPTLEGQCCHIEQELEFYWQRLAKPEGQAWDFASSLSCLLWEDAPLLGQCCTVEVSLAQPEKTTYTEFVEVSDRIGYIRVNTTGEIIATYAGFNNKSRAKSWANYLEAMTSRIELRAAKRLGDWKHELKISGLSIKQIERLAAENLDKMPPEKEQSLPPTYKPQPIPQSVKPDEVGEGDIVTALLTPSSSYKIIQVMPNGILDCENLTTGDRLGLRPGAVSLVQKAEKLQPEVTQQVIDFEPKPDAPTKYARVKLKGDKFDGQVFGVVKGNELGSTLLTPNGHHWFHADCLEFIDPDAQITTGIYKGLSKQMRQHWEKVGINPSDLIADMKAKRPPEPEWDAAKYNPIQRELAAVGADDDLDF
jgi:hypothetical protein